MRRPLAVIQFAVLFAAMVTAVAVAKSNSGEQHGKAKPKGPGKGLTVIEHATTDATTDTGATGDSAGDILTFANDVYDAADKTKVGTDQGSCVRIVVGESYECTWTTLLPKGQLTVEGPFYDKKDSVLAITGGTGRYRNARGFMELQSREGGTKFAFIFHITG
jgi:hypothetical protein